MRLSLPLVRGALVLSGLALARPSSADTTSKTITLNQSSPQVVYATLRAGAYQNRNLPTTLTVPPADTKDDNRRALLKFDTRNAIPAGSAVTSARMTVTVGRGTGSNAEGLHRRIRRARREGVMPSDHRPILSVFTVR